MKYDKKVPNIRFKNNTESWKESKGKELFVEIIDKGHPDLPVLSATQDRGMIRRDENGINIQHDMRNEDGYKRVAPGQFVVHLRSFQGGFAHSSIEGITSPAYTIFDFFNKDNQNDYFWKYIFNSLSFIRRLESVIYGIRDGRSINYNDFLLMNLYYPKIKEQNLIAIFFKNLDKYIDINQSKLRLLLNLKQALLKKIFPKQGSDIPDIRFKDFSDSWKQHKLGEIVESCNNEVKTPKNGYYRVGVRSHARGTFHEFVKPGHELMTGRMFKIAPNCLIVNITFAWEHAVAITKEEETGMLVSHRFPQFKFDTERAFYRFFKYVILDLNFKHHLWLASPGGAGRNRVLNIKQMLGYNLKLPSLIEQNKIASICELLEKNIALHKRKLVLLKNLKQSLLKKMFI